MCDSDSSLQHKQPKRYFAIESKSFIVLLVQQNQDRQSRWVLSNLQKQAPFRGMYKWLIWGGGGTTIVYQLDDGE
jgi:hypothetical protein